MCKNVLTYCGVVVGVTMVGVTQMEERSPSVHQNLGLIPGILTSVTPALVRWRQVDQKFKVTLSHLASSRPVWDI